MSVYCDDLEPAAVWNERRVKARKEHTCSACRETIRKGDSYIRDAMLYDGSWSVVFRCLRCDLIFNHLQERMADDECPARELNCGHEYRERWGEEPPEWLAALAFWVPGDPLPATIPCISLMRDFCYGVPRHQQAKVCTDQAYGAPRGSWDYIHTLPSTDTCAATLDKYELRTGNRIAVPVKGNLAHTEPCS